ncbi:MAG: pseudouridine-5'-phosphate glycosidase [Gemmataceae bacterium]
MIPDWLAVTDEVRAALAAQRPVVALESTLIAHGLPWPVNLETARESETAVRAAGAVPATIAIWRGVPTVGLGAKQLEELARAEDVFKASRRDLGAAVALKRLAATTVSATMALAHAAGIAVFATGGIGGVHPGDAMDISADLTELARTSVLVVCAGAKSILDLPRTLELLETLGVPVLGFRTDRFPAFYVVESSLPVSCRVDSASAAAAVFAAHVCTGGGGVVLANPCRPDLAISEAEFRAAWEIAERDAVATGIRGAARTPFLLSRLATATSGRTLVANRALIVANARLAAEVAVARANLPLSAGIP